MTARDYLPDDLDLSDLLAASRRCRGCDIHAQATQTVFGEGPPTAPVVVVGEQPGDVEDREGRPFVGPAGRLLDEGLRSAGLDRDSLYVTNAVKHFKWKPRGKRRIHQKPTTAEVRACYPWLEAELDAVHPRLVVCLGATAALSLLGPDFRVTKRRGQIIDGEPAFLATVHPSSILRVTEASQRQREMAAFIDDLSVVGRYLAA